MMKLFPPLKRRILHSRQPRRKKKKKVIVKEESSEDEDDKSEDLDEVALLVKRTTRCFASLISGESILIPRVRSSPYTRKSLSRIWIVIIVEI